MKKYLFILISLFTIYGASAQNDLTENVSSDQVQYVFLSSDDGMSLDKESNLLDQYYISISHHGWKNSQLTEVINNIEAKSSYVDLVPNISQDRIVLELIIVPGENDSWGITEWNNHLNTIK